METKIIIKPFEDSNEWITLPCRNVLDSFEYTEQYFSEKNFSLMQPTASLELRLTSNLIKIFLEAPSSFPCLIEANQNLIFGGFLDNSYSHPIEKYLNEEDASWRARFNIMNWAEWFNFELEESFNPYSTLDSFEPLFICNPYLKEKSILHLLFNFLDCPFSLDNDLIINERTESFIIKENENVLESLNLLLWEVRRYFKITPTGRFESDYIKSSPKEDDIEKLPSIGCFESMNKTTAKKEITEITVEWASISFKSAKILKAQKKAIHSASGYGLNDEGKANPLAVLIPEGIFPEGSLDTEEWIKPTGSFLQTSYDMTYVKEGVFGFKTPLNKDISIVGFQNYEIGFDSEEEIELNYFQKKVDQIAYQFINTLTKEDASLTWSEKTKTLFWVDVFADTIYRHRRNKISLNKEEEIKNKVRNKRNFLSLQSRPLRKTTEIFLEYVNDSLTARAFFDRQQSLIENQQHIFTFNSKKKLEINEFYNFLDSTGFLFTLLIVSKKFSLERVYNRDSEKMVVIYSYKAMTDFEIQDFNKKEEGGQGALDPPPPLAIYYISNEYDKLNSYIKTDYTKDEATLLSLDDQVQTAGGQIYLLSSVFFSKEANYKSPFISQSGAVLRIRPLNQISFENEISNVPIIKKRGALIKFSLKGKKIENLSTGDQIFKWT